MTCARARRLLAAYRRDEWSPGELEEFGKHLAGCADCRRIEASFRQVGESVRQLPSIMPSPVLRARVFAAIAADQARAKRAPAALSALDTLPRLPAVPRVRADTQTRRPLVFGTPAAIAVAALLLIGLMVARFLPSLAPGLPSIAASLSGAAPASLVSAVAPRISQYAAPASAGRVHAALASTDWVVYVASGADGSSMLYAVSRSTHHTLALLPAALASQVTLRGMSDQWVLWQSGSNSASGVWTLAASRLPSVGTSTVLPPLVLATNNDNAPATPALLSGLWIAHDTVLLALSTHGSGAEVIRFDLFADEQPPLTRLIARTTLPGHALTDPSMSGSTVYWAEAWLDHANALHSDVWRGDGVGAAQKVTQSGLAFAPRTTAQALIWVQSGGPLGLDAATLAAQPAQAIQNGLDTLQGSIQSQNLASGGNSLVASNGTAASLAVSGPLVVWRDGAQLHTFDLSRTAPSLIDRDVRDAAYAGATATSLTWGQANTATISVFDHD